MCESTKINECHQENILLDNSYITCNIEYHPKHNLRWTPILFCKRQLNTDTNCIDNLHRRPWNHPLLRYRWCFRRMFVHIQWKLKWKKDNICLHNIPLCEIIHLINKGIIVSLNSNLHMQQTPYPFLKRSVIYVDLSAKW